MVKKEHISLLRENERIIMTLHRHWIILLAHLTQVLVLVVISTFGFLYKEQIIGIVGGSIYWGLFSFFWIIYLTFMLVDWMNDELDLFIITDGRVIWIEQMSALTRNVSECSLGRIQEVNAHVSGIWQTLFNFGDVHIHTASEHSNMIVRYAPDPVENARRINNIISEYRASQKMST